MKRATATPVQQVLLYSATTCYDIYYLYPQHVFFISVWPFVRGEIARRTILHHNVTCISCVYNVCCVCKTPASAGVTAKRRVCPTGG